MTSVDQTIFRAALLNPSAEKPLGLKDAQGRAAGRRFNVYRNNVATALSEALETAFPIIAKLVGTQNFRALAGAFFRTYPPTSPLMMFYGAKMPEFLTTFEPTKSIGYLPDVARLELALRHSYHAADTRAIDPEELRALPPDKLMSATLTLAPSLQILASRWPIYSIWRFNMEADTPKPIMKAEEVAVFRADLDPEPLLLPTGGAAFLRALQTGEAFAVALDAATAANVEFDLAGTLALAINYNAITKIGGLT